MSECSNATYIFKIPQCWLVPAYLVTNQQHTEIIGRRTTGDLKTDRIVSHKLIPIHGYLSDLAVVFRDGHRIAPADKATGIKAFNHLTGHLIDWANYVTSVRLLDNKPIPIEGLRELSELANGVYKVAKENGYSHELVVRRNLWSKLGQGRRTRKDKEFVAGGYNTAMIETIEAAYRRNQNRGMVEELGGADFEKRRF